jgi:hypothetical protein
VNKGRAPTEVQHFRCKLSNGFALADAVYPISPPIPFVLEPQRSKTWWLPAQEVNAIQYASKGIGKPATTAHMEVDTTGPKTWRTKSFPLTASS